MRLQSRARLRVRDEVRLRARLRINRRANALRPVRRGAAPRESISPVYLAAGCGLFADGCHSTGRDLWLYGAAGVRLAGSRLSDHPGAHVLSGSQPDSDVDNGDRAIGAPI